MATYNIIIDQRDEIEELSALLNTHDETGDVDPDNFVKMSAVCAALAYCNSKVSETDRGEYKDEDFQSQIARIDEAASSFYSGETYSIIRTAIDLFISNISADLIMALSDQSHTPIFTKIREDLSLVFAVMDGKNGTENNSGDSSTT